MPADVRGSVRSHRAQQQTAALLQLLPLAAISLREKRKQQEEYQASIDAKDWRKWLTNLFAAYFTHPFSSYHAEFWEHVWNIEPRKQPQPFVSIWPRSSGKSTNAEAAVVAVAAHQTRKYCLYVARTQSQADTHVANIASLLESEKVGALYPALSDRLLSKFGSAKGWRANRLRTKSGFTVDAVGLDRASRGLKIDEQRPDLIIIDDIDQQDDTPATVDANVLTITRKVLQLGSNDCAIIAVQNMVHEESIFARLAGVALESADFLVNRVLSGPFKAINGLTYETVGNRTTITGGEPTWEEGLSIEACQQRIDQFGLEAFLAENQHTNPVPQGISFPEFSKEIHVVPRGPVDPTWNRWCGLDSGYASPYVCLWIAMAPSGQIIVYNEVYKTRILARDQALEVKMMSAGQRIRGFYCDPAAWANRMNGQPIESVAGAYKEIGINLIPANNDRLMGLKKIHELLAWTPANSETKQPMIPPQLVIADNCPNLIRELSKLVQDEVRQEDVDTALSDHAYDALRYGLLGMFTVRPHSVKVKFG